jgi:hypothetical protein
MNKNFVYPDTVFWAGSHSGQRYGWVQFMLSEQLTPAEFTLRFQDAVKRYGMEFVWSESIRTGGDIRMYDRIDGELRTRAGWNHTYIPFDTLIPGVKYDIIVYKPT